MFPIKGWWHWWTSWINRYWWDSNFYNVLQYYM